MGILLRYAFLLALGLAAAVAFVDAMTATGHILIYDGSQSSETPRDLKLWVLAGMAVLSLASLFRFVFARVPSFFRDWFAENWDRLATMTLVVTFAAFFLLA